MKCKTCKRIVHYCSSCSPDELYDKGFCSEKCRELDIETKSAKIIIK